MSLPTNLSIHNNTGYISKIQDNSYTQTITSRYENSNIKEIKEGLNTYAYEYDNLTRLTKVTKNNQAVEQYTYDAQGNRISSTVNGAPTTASYNNDDELITYGANSYTHDTDGYLKTKTDTQGTTTYTYGTLGELKTVSLSNGTTISYAYNANNQRVSKSVNNQITEKYLWLNLTTLLAVYDGSGNLKQRFVYADERTPVAYTDKDGNIFYLSYNHIGTLKAVTDQSNNIIKSVEYDSFGNILSDTNPTLDVHLGFAGGLYDKETKLTRFGHRDYDSYTGRWTAKDPIDFSGGDSNLYGYVLGDPINFIDPTGEWVWVAVGAVIGAAINVGVTLYTNPQASARELVGAAIGGAIGGAIGSLAGPFGGTVSKAISGAVSKSISIPVNAGVSALGGGLGQAAQNAIDPCNYKNPLNAALASGIGGGVAGFIPTKNLKTISQARNFGMGWGGNALSKNNIRNLGATVTSGGIAAVGNNGDKK
jgi:RHS repeat-associated protein